MQIYTNMTWPGDPYRTGQQLFRRPAPRLAAFTAGRPISGSPMATTSAAIVYLPLHRTRALTVTGQTPAFGFRAASIGDEAESADLARLADLDLMQARRHAAILTGYVLPADLAVLSTPIGGTVLRGLSAVRQDWAGRSTPSAGRAAMFDCALDMPASTSLDETGQQASLVADAGHYADWPEYPATRELHAASAVARALIIALVCARHLGRYAWEGTLRTDEILAASAWDCFPQLPASSPAALASGGMADSQLLHGSAALTGRPG